MLFPKYKPLIASAGVDGWSRKIEHGAEYASVGLDVVDDHGDWNEVADQN